MLLIIQLIKISTFFVFGSCQITSSNWTPVTMRKTNVDGYNLTSEKKGDLSLRVIMNGCNGNPLCNTVCLVNDVYKYFENTIDAGYCEDTEEDSYQCWSNQAYEIGTMMFDGLYYKVKQKVKLNHDEARQCCRRTPGYHMAILESNLSLVCAKTIRISSGFNLYVHVDLQPFPGPHGFVRWGDGSEPDSSFVIEDDTGEHTTPKGVQINYINSLKVYDASFKNPVLCQERFPLQSFTYAVNVVGPGQGHL